MGGATGPKIETDGLELLLDADSQKSATEYNPDNRSRSHGLSLWYAFESDTVRYSAIYPGTVIYSMDISGNISVVVSETSVPTGGNLSTTVGYRYFANKPIYLLGQGSNHTIVPISLQGTYFGNYSTRYGTSTFHVYCPSGSGTVNHFDNVAGGVTGTATTSTSISASQYITFTSTTENNYNFFSSDVPVIMSVEEESNRDLLRMPPAGFLTYRKRSGNDRKVNNTSVNAENTYYISSSEYPAVTIQIADGSGGDANQGMPLENLSDTFSWGDRLSDYHITAPYSNTVVNVSYYSEGSWILAETHELNGSLTSPATAFREGNTGFGTSGNLGDGDGNAAYFASDASLWKWESNNPIFVLINDTTNDEEPLLGWMRNDESSHVVRDLSGQGNDSALPKLTIKTQNQLKSFDLDGSNLIFTRFGNGRNPSTQPFTVEAWVRSDQTDTQALWLDVGSNGTNQRFYAGITTANRADFGIQSSSWSNGAPVDTNWHHQVLVMDGSTARFYDNGVEVQTKAYTSYTLPGNIIFGGRAPNTYTWTGELTKTRVYGRALPVRKIQRNFNAFKRRFGL